MATHLPRPESTGLVGLAESYAWSKPHQNLDFRQDHIEKQGKFLTATTCAPQLTTSLSVSGPVAQIIEDVLECSVAFCWTQVNLHEPYDIVLNCIPVLLLWVIFLLTVFLAHPVLKAPWVDDRCNGYVIFTIAKASLPVVKWLTAPPIEQWSVANSIEFRHLNV